MLELNFTQTLGSHTLTLNETLLPAVSPPFLAFPGQGKRR